MRCPSCDRENNADAKFCKGCGDSLASVCPSCGDQLDSDASFCDKCGASVAEAEASTTSPEPSPALPASLAAGRYEVKGFLGEGGRKRVYLARDTRLERDVAVAMIKTDGCRKAPLRKASVRSAPFRFAYARSAFLRLASLRLAS